MKTLIPGAVRKVFVATTALASAIAVALLIAIPAESAPDRPVSASGVSESIPWAQCDWPHGDLQCARIRVPLDWDRPGGRKISLAVIRHLASKPDQRIGTAFINPGGPGDTGLGLLKGDPEGVDEIGGGRFDVVSWDPRGTNSSTQVRCFRSPGAETRFWAGAEIPLTRAGTRRALRRSVGLAKRCGKVGGWLLPHISTADTARDLDHLRKLVGEKKLTYIGLSYGTYLGQTYANMFPGRVRAMLLNGLVDARRYSKSTESRTAMFASSADTVFSRLLSLCDEAGPELCKLTRNGQSAAKRVDRLFARVRRHAIPAPGATPPGLSRAKLTYTRLLFSQFQPLRAPSGWPDDAANLDAAIRGDGSALASEGGFFEQPAGWSAASISTAIQCADAGSKSGPRGWLKQIGKLARKSRLQGRVQGWWLAPCASWPVKGQDTYRGPWNAETPNPILLINQRFDPSTNYANAVRAEKYLGNAVLLTHEGYGHLAFQNPSSCVDKAMVDYLVDLVTPPEGAVCESNRKPFAPDFGQEGDEAASGTGTASASGTGSAAATAAAASSRRKAARIAWKPCGKRLDCARVRVPLDWKRGGNMRRASRVRHAARARFRGPKISIAVIRYRASRPGKRIGSLFVNYGGPGVAGVATVRGVGETLDELARGRFDIVGWDPRGTGKSTHVSCFANDRKMKKFWGPDWGVPTTKAESRRYVPKTIAFAKRCAARNPRLVKHISTADTVRDLDYLRHLAGDRRINYRGLSYGTFLGQTYANMFPRRVRSMILDSVLDPVKFTRSLEQNIASAEADSDLVLEKFSALCEEAGPANCALAGNGPVAPRVQGLFEQLREGPIPAPSAPPPHQLDYGDALITWWLAEGTPANWPAYAEALNQALEGDGSTLEKTVKENTVFFQQALDAATALQCSDKPLPRPGMIRTWPRVVNRLTSVAMVTAVDAWWLWAPCASWPVRSADRYTGPWNATTKNPVLVLSNRYDARTAHANSRVASNRLGNAVLVTNNGYGHTTESDPSACIEKVVGRYLVRLGTPPDRTVCQPDRKPFDPDFGEPLP